jgi:hypothetical protein|tara:strand:- start:189 stop:452 length:264 start_codon:yes stop_codon:yes gene_type:complete
MMKKKEQFGKEISYNIADRGSWLHIKEGNWSWLYVTKDFDFQSNNTVTNLSKELKVEITNISRKNMFDLLNHFNVKESKNVFNKQSV